MKVYVGATNAEVTISADRSGDTVNFTIDWEVSTDKGWTSLYRKLVIDGSTVLEDSNSFEVTGTLTRSLVTPYAGTKTVSCELWGRDVSHDDSVSFEISADYPAQTCTITFNAYPGTVSEQSRVVPVGQPLGTLPVPVPPAGYAFTGWYINDQEITAETLAGVDATLTAHYTARAALYLSRNGTVTAVRSVWTVEGGTPRGVSSLWNVHGA